jgi:hypothetical protein
MSSIFIWLVSISILLPLIAGLIRFRRIGKGYQPFFILIVTGVVAELINGYVAYIKHASNAGVSNIYILAEWILIVWQFQVWGTPRLKKNLYYALMAVSCSIWVTENLVTHHIGEFSPYFRFFYSFFIVLFSVNKINFMITHDNRNLLRHPGFLICIGFIIYFIYKIIYEWAYQSSLFGAMEITTKIIMLDGYINALTNIIFAIALMKIPAPEKFTLR